MDLKYLRCIIDGNFTDKYGINESIMEPLLIPKIPAPPALPSTQSRSSDRETEPKK